MKNLLTFTLALSALAFVCGACSTDDLSQNETPVTPTTQKQIPISFDNYVGRSVTRGTPIEDINGLRGTDNGFGVFAMFTSGKKYSSSTGDDYENNFSANFMDNIHVSAPTETETSKQNLASDATWSYNPVRYWPQSEKDYVSFLSYAPWDEKAKLVSSTGTSTGDLTYIDWTVDATQTAQKDLMVNTNDASNQQLLVKTATDGTKSYTMNGYKYTDATTLVTNGNFSTNATGENSNYRQKMKYAHATARIGFVVTSQILATTGNFADPTETDKNITFETPTAAGTQTGTQLSNTKITINKIALRGAKPTTESTYDPSKSFPSDLSDNTKVAGAFYQSAYVNLRPTVATDGSVSNLWSYKTYDATNTKANALQSFLYDNTQTASGASEPTIVTADGTYKATLSSGDKKLWTPNTTTKNVLQASRKVTRTVTNSGTESEPNYSYSNYAVATGENIYTAASPIGNAKDGYLFIVPQDFTLNNTGEKNSSSGEGNGANSLYCEIEYTVNYADLAADADGNKVTYHGFGKIQNAAADATNKDNYNFQAGKSYIIVINIGPSATPGDVTPDPDPKSSFAPIQFTVEEVGNWGTENETDANL